MTNNCVEETNDQKKRCVTLYQDVGDQVNKILSDLSSINVKNKKGNAHLESLKSQLTAIREQFSEEIHFLEEHSEWDKFTIAFFGETGAGKSTILESLRILFEERKRQDTIRQNFLDTLNQSEDFSKKTDSLLSELELLYQRYHETANSIADEVSALVAQYHHNHSTTRKVLIWSGYLALGLICGLGLGALIFGGA